MHVLESIHVTLDVSHDDKSPLKDDADRNTATHTPTPNTSPSSHLAANQALNDIGQHDSAAYDVDCASESTARVWQ